MAEVGEPTQYGYAERLMRTIKEEEVDLSEYRDYHDVYQHIGQFIEDVYMLLVEEETDDIESGES